MQWTVKKCDILDEPADVLVCSANPLLNLSGGVGGAFAERYGEDMQRELHEHLAANDLRHVQPGDVIQMPPCGSPYQAVLHAVAVDAVYDTSPEVVTTAVTKALEIAAALSASKVTLAAIGTGYGRLSLTEFADALWPVMEAEFPPIEQVVVCLRKQEDIDELSGLLPRVDVA